jgi:hypothetical protein
VIASIVLFRNSTLQHFHTGLCIGIWLLFWTFLVSPLKSFADDEPAFDETSVFLNLSGYGGMEMEALIKEDQVYLPVSDVFEYLKIQHTRSSDLDVLSGFFISEKKPYRIDKNSNQIVLEGQTFKLSNNDLVLTPTGLFLRSEVFGKVFGLDLIFDFRSLSVNLNTKHDLPVLREKRQELMRQNLNKLRSEVKADTAILRKYPVFNFGSYDWSVNSWQQPNGEHDTRMNVRLGTMLLGGETNLGLNYDTRRGFDLRDQQYQWRYVNNDRKGMRQLKAGKIPVQSASTLFAPVIGMQVTNSPTTYRRSFGSYNLSDHTEPGWIVELYINNILVDYVKADASGFFSFKVPLIYGSTNIQLRYFGPWGEERLKEERVNVPYNFLPKNELEYTFSAGILENNQQSRFSRLDVKYGVNDRITIGTGTEYLSGITDGAVMPFVNASARLGPSLILSGDYTYGVRGQAALNYRMPGEILLQLDYIRYKKGQTVTFHNYLEERKGMISKPYRIGKFSGFSRLSVSQIIYPSTSQTTADLLLSASLKGVSANMTTYAQSISGNYLNVYSTLSLGMRLPGQITFRPQIQFGYSSNRLQLVRTEVERPVFRRGYLNLSYQNNMSYGSGNINLGVRFDLSFARTAFSARNSNQGITFSQSLAGGGLLDLKTNFSKVNNRSNVGKGGLILYPYLDLNLNNQKDKGEPKVQGLELQMNAGRIENSLKDTTIRIFDLEAYNSYLLELKPSSFDNIAYQLKNKSYKVAIEPNKLRLIEIPVIVAGEASGMVYSGNSEDGQGRMLVNFYREGRRVAQTLSESDGYFTFLGLAPGTYTAAIDSAQLQKLNLTALPRTFIIDKTLDGDVEDGLDLRLLPRAEPELAVAPASKAPATIPAEKSSKDISSGFSIVARGTGDRNQALNAQNSLSDQSAHPVAVSMHGTHSYSVKIGGFKSLEDAEKFLAGLPNGFKNGFVIPPSGGRSKGTSGISGEPAAATAKTPPAIDRAVKNQAGETPEAEDSTKKSQLYALIVGQATTGPELRSLQILIRQTLKRSAFTMKKGDTFRLQVIGFANKESAEEALRNLNEHGITGYLLPYQEKEVKVSIIN